MEDPTIPDSPEVPRLTPPLSDTLREDWTSLDLTTPSRDWGPGYLEGSEETGVEWWVGEGRGRQGQTPSGSVSDTGVLAWGRAPVIVVEEECHVCVRGSGRHRDPDLDTSGSRGSEL